MADIENKKDTTEAPKKDDKPAKPKKDKVPVGERIKTFLRTYKSEFKKIVWASPKSVVSNTTLVIVTIVAIGAVIGALDYVFSLGIVGLGRLI